jgi:DNA-binding ferritin-like protein
MPAKKKNTTRKNTTSSQQFQQEITKNFLELLMSIKLYHWKTHSYAVHKATDDLYGELNTNIDKFMEVLLGKTSIRTNLIKQKTIQLLDLTSKAQLIQLVKNFKDYLVGLSNNKFMLQNTMSNTDLLNIRDELLANLNQFLYLLTLNE